MIKRISFVFIIILIFTLSLTADETNDVSINNRLTKTVDDINSDLFIDEPNNFTASDNTSDLTANIIDFFQDNTSDTKQNDSEVLKDNDSNKSNKIDITNSENMTIKELEVKYITAEEGKTIYISIKDSGWIIKKIFPEILTLVKRENFDTNTQFKFSADKSGEIDVIFIRNDIDNNTLWRQVYKILIKPKNFITIKKTDETNADAVPVQNNEDTAKKEDNKKEEDHVRRLADQHFAEKNYKEAKKRYEMLIQDGQEDSEVNFNMGIIERNLSDMNSSNEYFKKVLEDKESPYYVDALIELIKNLKALKKYDEAIDVYYQYGTTVEIPENKAERFVILIADVFFYMKDYKSSSNEYRRFIGSFPDSINIDKAIFFLAYSLENLRVSPDYNEAFRLYKIIVDKYPESDYTENSKKRMMFLERHYIRIF